MSSSVISHSTDLAKLQNEGYEIEVKSNYLLIHHIPYVNGNKEILFGTLVSKLDITGETTSPPESHVIYFIGEIPCNCDGQPLTGLVHHSKDEQLAEGLIVNHMFSNVPPSKKYNDYYDKVTKYTSLISTYARRIDNSVSANVNSSSSISNETNIFNYPETASSRSGITAISDKLKKNKKIGIVGLGGTGSYILDLLAKTPVQEIHIFDDDVFQNHNAFRSPGAPTLEELSRGLLKVDYFVDIYSKMRKGIVPHQYKITESNVQELLDFDFIFICVDNNDSRNIIFNKLNEYHIPFIDTGIGLHITDDALLGSAKNIIFNGSNFDEMLKKKRVPISDSEIDNIYDNNIQIADLNLLNAGLAIIKWKKLCGFYLDLENETKSTYQIDGNFLINEE